MKRLTVLLALFLIINMGCAKDDIALETEKEKLSYAVGMDIAKNLKRQNLELEPDIVARGMRWFSKYQPKKCNKTCKVQKWKVFQTY